MTHHPLIAALFLSFAAAPAFAQGNAETGEGVFNRCKSCHTIADGDDVIVRGGRSGPNLFGIIGSAAGAEEGFRYGAGLTAAAEAGLVWDEENLATYVADPGSFLQEFLGSGSARSNMGFRLRNGGEDVAAYLATFSAPDEGDVDDAGDDDGDDSASD